MYVCVSLVLVLCGVAGAGSDAGVAGGVGVCGAGRVVLRLVWGGVWWCV